MGHKTTYFTIGYCIVESRIAEFLYITGFLCVFIFLFSVEMLFYPYKNDNILKRHLNQFMWFKYHVKIDHMICANNYRKLTFLDISKTKITGAWICLSPPNCKNYNFYLFFDIF